MLCEGFQSRGCRLHARPHEQIRHPLVVVVDTPIHQRVDMRFLEFARLSNETQHHVDRRISALAPLPDASHYGRHRSWDIEGRELKHCAARLAVFLYGTLVLPERRSGHVIMLLGLFAAAMPVMHMRGAHYGEIAKSPG